MADEIELDDVEQRVLGCLLEKQRTVPGSYPLSENALRSACNQSSSRDPVVDYDPRTVLDAVGRLKERGLLRTVWAGAGSRVLKYHQLLDEVLGLDEPARALVTVLLLRGAQTAGELRTRTDRLHGSRTRRRPRPRLRALAEGGRPLVRELPRAPGHKDTRWLHLLGPSPSRPRSPRRAGGRPRGRARRRRRGARRPRGRRLRRGRGRLRRPAAARS